MINKTDNKFIVYAHLNAVTNDVFYIGIGIPGREKQKCKRSIRWTNYVNKYGFIFIVLKNGITWCEACRIEKRLIQLFGRKDMNSGNLINMTNGGDGSGGHKGFWKGKKRPPISESALEKCKKNASKYWLGKNITDEMKEKLRIARKGKKQSEETKAKYKNRIPWNKGKKTGMKGPSFWLGKTFSEEHKTKIGLSHLGKKRSAETCEKIGMVHRGKVVSIETKQKISSSLKKALK